MSSVPFDQLDGFIWMNGEFVKWGDAKVHVLTHGLHYAGAVFEGETVYFCGAGCKARFDAQPELYLRRSAVSEAGTATP